MAIKQEVHKTELSFFEIPLVGRTHRGTNAITKIGLIVPSEESLVYWQQRLTSYGVEQSEMSTYLRSPCPAFRGFRRVAHGTHCGTEHKGRTLGNV